MGRHLLEASEAGSSTRETERPEDGMVSPRDILMTPVLIPAGLMFKREWARRRLYHVLKPLLKHVVNPYGLRDADRRETRFGVVHHVGRRSGVSRETPIEPHFVPGGVLIPLAFGPEADWCRNILAAGGCTLTFRGSEFVLEQPDIVRCDVAEAQMPDARARASQDVGIDRYLSLRIVSPADAGAGPRAPEPRSVA
jgi:deazaflavin-dependent oxidoreductase (nitroreductase family)